MKWYASRLSVLVSVLLAALLRCAPAGAQTLPYVVDLSAAANTSLEDNAPAGSSERGWSGEGVNDMFMYPRLPVGDVIRNGYPFKLIDPATNQGKAVILLRGSGRLQAKPADVTVSVPAVKGAYLYFIQNSVGDSGNLPPGYLAAEYTVHYADGTAVTIPIHEGEELHHWWTGAWYENSGARSWPVWMGQNAESIKWRQYIGVWAMEWQNPSPMKPITSISFHSEGHEAPAIFAVTISSEDYFHNPHVKDDYSRPAEAPPDYFRVKLAQEQALLFQEMVRHGMVQGVRSVALLRPDLLAVTLDTVVSGGAGPDLQNSEALAHPERFTVTGPGGSAGIHPTAVSQQTFLYDTVDVGPYLSNQFFWHTYTLKLPAPLQAGREYRVSVQGLRPGFRNTADLTFDDRRTVTPAIKVNQASYSVRSSRRYAYLGWWAGDLGAVDFHSFRVFEVLPEAGGPPVLQGAITLRKAGDAASGEDVYQMDLSPLKTPGRYFIRVPGLGRSYPFALGDVRGLYQVAMRGFWYQRCGQGRSAPDDYPHPPCHLWNYQNGHLVGGAEEHYRDGKLIPASVPHAPGEPVREFRGGYHDAGDYDMFYYHLRATARILDVYEQSPRAFRDGDLRIAESGNGIPDLLDEAAWGLKFYIDNQQPGGGIFAGRANDEDYGRDEWKQEWAKQFGSLPPFGNFPPCCSSSATFAAVAAEYSRLIRPFDKRQADRFADAARKAYAWAQAHHTTDYDKLGPSYGRLEWPKALAWAAAELFKTTGEDRYNQDFIALYRDPQTFQSDWKTVNDLPVYWWPYATSSWPSVNRDVQESLRKSILDAADDVVANTEKSAYRMGSGHENGGWGNLCGGGYYGDVCLMAYYLGGKQSYLDAASLNADYQLGANPLSRSFITGLGSRPPEHPELRAPL